MRQRAMTRVARLAALSMLRRRDCSPLRSRCSRSLKRSRGCICRVVIPYIPRPRRRAMFLLTPLLPPHRILFPLLLLHLQ